MLYKVLQFLSLISFIKKFLRIFIFLFFHFLLMTKRQVEKKRKFECFVYIKNNYFVMLKKRISSMKKKNRGNISILHFVFFKQLFDTLKGMFCEFHTASIFVTCLSDYLYFEIHSFFTMNNFNYQKSYYYVHLKITNQKLFVFFFFLYFKIKIFIIINLFNQ